MVNELILRRGLMGARSGGVDWETLCIGILSGDISTINIPEGVTKLRTYALYGTQATTITLPSTLTTAGSFAFGGNAQLTSIDFGSGLTQVPESALRNCTNLKDVILPAQIYYINYVAFYGLRSWTLTMLREASVVTKHNVIWDEAPQAIYVPDAVVSTYQASTPWSSFSSIIKPLSQKP